MPTVCQPFTKFCKFFANFLPIFCQLFFNFFFKSFLLFTKFLATFGPTFLNFFQLIFFQNFTLVQNVTPNTKFCHQPKIVPPNQNFVPDLTPT